MERNNEDSQGMVVDWLMQAIVLLMILLAQVYQMVSMLGN